MGKRSLFKTWKAEDWAKMSPIILLVTWLPTMFTSLWLDELGTYWTISGSLSDTVFRATEFQGQSPFTYVLMWAWNALLSPGDFGLRLLPVLFGLGTFVGIYSIARRIAGPSAGWFAVAASVSLYDFRFLVVNLRPYAFAFFFLAWSTRLLIAWEDRSTRFIVVGYVLTTAAAVWSVYYSVFYLVGHVLYVVVRRREGDGQPTSRFVCMISAVVVLCLPLVPHLASLRSRAEQLHFVDMPPFRFVLDGLLPTGMLGIWLVVVVTTGLPSLAQDRKSERLLALSLLLAPSVLLYLVARLSGLGQWMPRYRSAFLIGFALAASIWLAGYETDRKQTRAVLVMVLAGLLISPPSQFLSEDWRAALLYADKAISSDQLVVLNSGFVEAASYEFLADPGRSALLTAPLSRYPVRQNVLLSPALPAEEAFPYLACAIDVTRYEEVAVVTRAFGPLTFDGFGQFLQRFGYSEVGGSDFPGVQVHLYRRVRQFDIESTELACAETARFQAESP